MSDAISGLFIPLMTINGGLVAPRGVCLIDERILVADTARNQVLVFDLTVSTEKPVLILGNENAKRNTASAKSLHYPSGVWTDGKQIILADAWNHRVLIWHQFPTHNYQEADTVIGQKDFEQDQPNGYGLNHAPSSSSLYWPYGVWSDGKSLWIADTGNRRILYFQQIPTTNLAHADKVYGQESFEEREFNTDFPVWPYAVKVNSKGEMLVADTQFYRCHYWRNHEMASRQKCDMLIGQPDFQANGQNQYRHIPSAQTLNWCYDAAFFKEDFLICDTGNSRILWFDKGAADHNPLAIGLVGQESFAANGEASLSMNLKEDQSQKLYWPFALSIADTRLAVADTGKSRILIYDLNILNPK